MKKQNKKKKHVQCIHIFPRDSFDFDLYEGKTVKRLKLDPFIAEILIRVGLI